jgi:TolB protein
MDADGRNLRTVLETSPNCSADHPSWSPDSTQLVYVSWCTTGPGTTAIEAIGIDGTGHTTLIGPADQLPETGPTDFNAVEYSSPAWSPDGSRILFVVRREAQSQIYIMNVDGTGITRLTSGSRDYSPVWSPDGTLIAFVSTRTGSSQIYVTNEDGGGLTRVTDQAQGEGQFTQGGADLAWLPLNE